MNRPFNVSRYFLAFGLLMSVAAGAHAAPNPHAAWQGTLEVHVQSGPACDPDRQLPYRIPVQLARDAEGWLLWGDLQTMRLRADGVSPLALQPMTEQPALGQLSMQFGPTSARGEWREGPAPDGCAFERAELLLDPQAESATGDLVARAAWARRLHAALNALDSASDKKAVQAVLRQQLLPLLGSDLASMSSPDADLAQRLLLAANTASAARDSQSARPLFEVAIRFFRHLETRRPADTALALIQYATWLHRSQGLQVAGPMAKDALDLLDRNAMSQSDAAAQVLGRLGAWQLLAGDPESAVRSFSRAAQVEEQRQAPARERSEALNNLGHALMATHRHWQARRILESALHWADLAGEPGQVLAAQLRQTLRSLGSGAGGLAA